ncbi:MAG: transcription termination factor NusA [Bacillota bacterium]|nr:transcription termination factor NusA [Bacillota bacterium]
MNQDFMLALEAIEKEKGIKKETLFEAIEAALISAYKRNFNSAHNVRVYINRETGEIRVYSCLDVVDKILNAQHEIHIDEARKKDPQYQLGDIVEIEVTPKNFGRVAAQTAKQVVIQRIREAERELVYEEYVDREEDIVTGLVQRFEQKNAIINLGKTEAILTPTEQIPGELYKQGDRIKAYIIEVKKTTKGPQILVSRTHPGLLKRLFELEVPEIYNGVVEIKSISREPGNRSKVAVFSRNKDVDPVGACVGPKGSRVQSVVSELKGEKIDIVEWSDDPEVFVARSLSPAKTLKVIIRPDNKSAVIVVPDYQLSLAIGKEGQNVRLAAKLSGCKIDIVSESKYCEKNSAKDNEIAIDEEKENIEDLGSEEVINTAEEKVLDVISETES